jgi:hypothetical protein
MDAGAPFLRMYHLNGHEQVLLDLIDSGPS